MMKSYKSELDRASKYFNFWTKVNNGASLVFVVILIVGGILAYAIETASWPDILGFIIAVVFCGGPPIIFISLFCICYYNDKRQRIAADNNIFFYLAKQGVPVSDMLALVSGEREGEGR
jgi:hypothetical protein